MKQETNLKTEIPAVTISVIMGVYNCADTVGEAIASILNQTVTDWEFIICDDGSQDDTYQIVAEYARKYPKKFVLIRNEQNLGLNATLNRCLKEAKGKYIARMDGDDICDPTRFAVELAVLETEPEIAIVSTDMAYFDERGVWGHMIHPLNPVNKDFLYGTPFCHAPCMVRREAYEAVGGYSEGPRLQRVEDYHLWLKMYKAGYKGKNLRLALYHMRDDRNANNRRKFKYRVNEAYVKALAVKELKLPVWGYLFALRPILVGLLPMKLYDFLHKIHLKVIQEMKKRRNM